MSFSIIFQKNNSPNNQITKSLTTVMTLSGTLRNETSVIDPDILVESDTSILQANYMTISEFNRKYFIRSIDSVRNNIWMIHGHVDVLGTYDTAIRANTAVIARQERQWNLYLDDGVFKCNQNNLILLKEFPNSFDNFQYVLALAGSGGNV